jgi:hypothetical protein
MPLTAVEVLEQHDRPIELKEARIDEITWDEEGDLYGFAVHSMRQKTRNALISWLMDRTLDYVSFEFNAARRAIFIKVDAHVLRVIKFKQAVVDNLPRLASEG